MNGEVEIVISAKRVSLPIPPPRLACPSMQFSPLRAVHSRRFSWHAHARRSSGSSGFALTFAASCPSL